VVTNGSNRCDSTSGASPPLRSSTWIRSHAPSPARRVRLDRVLEEVHEEAAHAELVSHERSFAEIDLDRRLAVSVVRLGHGLLDELRQTDPASVRRALHPRQVEEIADEALELTHQLHRRFDLAP
jgi:hypothetical protein